MTLDQADTRNDLELLELSRKGDHNAFGELIGKYRCSCVNLATFIMRDRVEAEDQVQQAFEKAFQHLNQYLGEAEFFIWLKRIVINECRMLMRTQKRVRFLYLNSSYDGSQGRPRELPSPTGNPEHELIKRELVVLLRTEIQHIPPLFRKVILLRDVEELPMPEVANRLGITVPAAKSRLLRARTELRGRVIRRCKPAQCMMPLGSNQIPTARPVPQVGSAT